MRTFEGRALQQNTALCVAEKVSKLKHKDRQDSLDASREHLSSASIVRHTPLTDKIVLNRFEA